LWFLLAALFFLFAVGLFGCDCGDDPSTSSGQADDDADDDTADDDAVPDVDDLIREGKDWLAFPDGDRARLFFLAALEIAPEHPEAMYGLVLSDTVHTTDMFSVLWDYIMSFIDHGGPIKSGFTGDDLVNGIFQNMLDGLLRERAAELIDYAGRCKKSGAAFEHDGIPIFIHYEEVAVLSTEFDDGELFAASAFAGIMSGLVYHMYALDLDFDLFNFFRLVELDYDELSVTQIVSAVVEVLLDILTDPSFPDFLTLPEENEGIFSAAGIEVGDGLAAWTDVFPSIGLETDDQTDDVMGYVDEDWNGAFDPRERFFLPHFGELDEDQMKWVEMTDAVVAGLRDSFYDYTVKDINPEIPNPFELSLLRPMAEELGLPGFIVPDETIDIGAWYVDAVGSGFKDSLVSVLQFIDGVLPDYEW